MAYVDHLAAIFVREEPGPAAFIDPALATGLPSPQADLAIGSLPGIGRNPRVRPLERWLHGLARQQEFPTEDLSLGLFHYYRGEMEPAQQRFASGIQSSRGAYFELYNNLGSALFHERRFKEARDLYLVVLEDDPENRLARERQASIAHLGAGR